MQVPNPLTKPSRIRPFIERPSKAKLLEGLYNIDIDKRNIIAGLLGLDISKTPYERDGICVYRALAAGKYLLNSGAFEPGDIRFVVLFGKLGEEYTPFFLNENDDSEDHWQHHAFLAVNIGTQNTFHWKTVDFDYSDIANEDYSNLGQIASAYEGVFGESNLDYSDIEPVFFYVNIDEALNERFTEGVLDPSDLEGRYRQLEIIE